MMQALAEELVLSQHTANDDIFTSQGSGGLDESSLKAQLIQLVASPDSSAMLPPAGEDSYVVDPYATEVDCEGDGGDALPLGDACA